MQFWGLAILVHLVDGVNDKWKMIARDIDFRGPARVMLVTAGTMPADSADSAMGAQLRP